jgi:hypothetical protein
MRERARLVDSDILCLALPRIRPEFVPPEGVRWSLYQAIRRVMTSTTLNQSSQSGSEPLALNRYLWTPNSGSDVPWFRAYISVSPRFTDS